MWMLTFAGMSVCWILFALASPPILAGAIFAVLQNTLMLSATPPRLQGRAMGLQELAIGAQPLMRYHGTAPA